MRVTPIGEAILAHARQMLEEAEAMVQLAQAHRDPMAGPLRIGAIPTLSPYLMPLILVPLKREHPQLRPILSEEMTDTLVTRLHNHEIDVALLATDESEDEFEVIDLFDEPFWFAYPSDHPLYLKETITRADLDDTDLLLLAEGHCLAQQVRDLCHLEERNADGAMADLRASSLETLLQFVGAGFGSTLVPALAMRGSWTSDTGVVTRELEFEGAYRRVSMVFRKSYPRKQALRAFAEVIWRQLPNTVRSFGPGKSSKRRK